MPKKILIVDFGSQTCHLIGRRLKDMGVEVEIIDPENALSQIKKIKPAGLIFSGGPASVYAKAAPTIDKKVFNLGIPILGICYGWQLTAQLLSGKVVSGHKEYGPATLKLKVNLSGDGPKSKILANVPRSSKVWVSHGDTVSKLPGGFEIIGSTASVKAAFITCQDRKIYGVQFHPEVEHTVAGKTILANFAKGICQLKIGKRVININKIIDKIKTEVGQAKVVGAVSGGTESTIASIFCIRAIGKNYIPVYVHSNLMRAGTKEFVKKIFTKYGVKPRIIDASQEFLKRLKGVVDPEKKRLVIGNLYYELIKNEIKKIKGVEYYLQGTVYSDVIESKGTKKADKIKSHHNVGGLPAEMGLKLLEPLREYYTDEVRKIGHLLKLPEEIIYMQPFPGPGHAIRIVGEVTPQRLAKQQKSDQIVLEELKKAGIFAEIFQSFSVMTGAQSAAVKGDGRAWCEVVAVRIVTTQDRMTADWARLPADLLQRISSRIVSEVPDISRVVYDITTKPPATMEWE